MKHRQFQKRSLWVCFGGSKLQMTPVHKDAKNIYGKIYARAVVGVQVYSNDIHMRHTIFFHVHYCFR